MSEDAVVKVEHVSKKFCRYLRASMRYGVQDIARSLVRLSTKPDTLRKHEFWAVDDVSFELSRGESLGIIGANGSGKSTMLKMLNGIFMPDKGRIEITGRVGPLIELGAGFHPMLTGSENIYINGAILGMSKKEIDRKFDDIVGFADIGDFLNTPVKNYSSGMLVRLGFAVAVHCEPDILLVDEVLAVGDMAFQSKCHNKLGEMRQTGVTTMMVSHNMHAISGFCRKVLYMNSGQVRYYGDVAEAIDIYTRDMAQKEGTAGPGLDLEEKVGSGRVRINKVQFLNENGTEVTEINAGSPLTLRVHYSSEGFTGRVQLDVAINDVKGNRFFEATNESFQQPLYVKNESGYFDVKFKQMCANNQRLFFDIALWGYLRSEFFNWKKEIPFYVAGNSLSHGPVFMDVDWTAR